MIVEMTVNGRLQQVDAQADETLLAVLRDRMHLRGAKDGCSEGECGACTVLLDGQPIDSCIYPAAAASHREVTTVEGLAPSNGELSALQKAFVEAGAVQCGFCTPGFLMTLTALLAENPTPAAAEVRDAISGNICRCTGYQDILSAISKLAGGL
ncbi:MAG TPA: (2Fe-2S)-binding protein [Streptosporangiaceae bacterium]|nr:(2Fe-2S)-binding protein [Streptosporangiaceae bacterium]